MTQPSPLELPGYTDLVEVGEGGFATVYRAKDARFHRDVAVKVLKSKGDEASQRRFDRECRAVGGLSGHPAIVAVYDSGVTPDGHPYLVMEWLGGGTLAARLADGPMEWTEADSMGVVLSGALETAHQAGVLHRDVKPENVMFTSYGAPKLVDFGIATVHGGDQTKSASITASIAHASPEIISGSPATAASDVYSLSSTLYQALAGVAAFAGTHDETLMPLIGRIATAPVPDLRPRGVPAALAATIERGMAKVPAERFASAAALGQSLIDDLPADVSRPAMVVLPAVAVVGGVAAVASGNATVPTPPPTGATQVVGRRREPVAAPPEAPQEGSRRRGLLVVAIAVAVVLLMGGTAFAVMHGPGDPQSPLALGTSSQASQLPSASPTPPAGSASAEPMKSAKSPSPTHTGSASKKASKSASTSTTTSSAAVTAQSSGNAGTGARGTSSTSAPPPVNHAPTLSVPSSVSKDERSSVRVTATGKDSDRDRLTYSASGLPKGLSISSRTGVISGTVSATAANVTTDRRKGIKTQTFRVNVRVTDGKKSASRTITWRIKDTHRVMPNYYGKYGCGGTAGCHESLPNVAAISAPGFDCTKSSPQIPNETIAKQSVAAGSIIRWGQSIEYWYQRASCGHA